MGNSPRKAQTIDVQRIGTMPTGPSPAGRLRRAAWGSVGVTDQLHATEHRLAMATDRRKKEGPISELPENPRECGISFPAARNSRRENTPPIDQDKEFTRHTPPIGHSQT
jgi:hypothetical protein